MEPRRLALSLVTSFDIMYIIGKWDTYGFYLSTRVLGGVTPLLGLTRIALTQGPLDWLRFLRRDTQWQNAHCVA